MTLEEVPAHVVVDASELEGELVLRVCGDLDMSTRDVIEPALMAAVASADSVIVDLLDLEFCDSTGIAMFYAVHEKAEADNTRFAFRNVHGIVLRAFEITGMDGTFGLAASRRLPEA